ncbi:4-oxalocrotonate tautomerase [Gordonia bronchialis DSM 43247]|uniref:4-oxalocrotonate tautomerase n=1 Tax=Gordonia bronchialis (strain ATCC 25592 / DSM 43247 / BCRC 13721 / JCM 3198 / KCTC 3076 / NBRC 16047 / NCTC 10667) TaxID=526226 RepID=D0L5B9_GORB4|nr:tautomerase family protein [Gordonia bronchialis]ACY23377.1 4-oxalocrotonate tautomerase [Gordonia bronchialis DSM 43247]MCC3321547.1 tautomerase family protein [Gordonia bronchialis]QGS26817.1 tautomerase family protein [Gordonia bronchialis]UAK36391.1 tautomerase family protein [Gordonia bronchialis]STQ66367.1 Tautomerase enzyme [Gordonia bronchialis]
MPLVHIHVTEGRRSDDELRRFADVVQDVMLEHFAAPDRDRYQIITEHKPGRIILEDTGLGFDRTDDAVVIQIFQQGRTLDHKRAAFRALADRLESETGLRPADLVISVSENTREDWSFGEGVAQFVDGSLA